MIFSMQTGLSERASTSNVVETFPWVVLTLKSGETFLSPQKTSSPAAKPILILDWMVSTLR